MTGNRSAFVDRLVLATVAVLVWGTVATWICGQLGGDQIVKIAAVGAGTGAIVAVAVLYPRRRRQ
jgi:hypothetical protein